MNCYYVSCELADRPELINKPVAVAPSVSRRKSIILTASYEARKYGIRAAMRVGEAERLCPNLILLEPNMSNYAATSRDFFEYFFSITPLVEVASIDEGYLDVTDVVEGADAIELAHRIQNYLLEEMHLPCSIGIAPNKFLAKMASDMKKPLGITVLRKREIPEKLWPLPISDMLGVGKKTLPLLEMLKIKTIGDLANYQDFNLLKETIGEASATGLVEHAKGNGSNVVDVERYEEVSSVSNSQTFDNDEYDELKIKQLIKILVNSVSYRLEKKQLRAMTFTLQIKYNTFKMTSRSRTLNFYTNDNHIIFNMIEDMFEDIYETEYGVRLVGVAASKLTKANDEMQQMSIFDSFDKQETNLRVNKLVEELQKNYGDAIIKQGIKINTDD